MSEKNIIKCSYCVEIPEEYLEMDCEHNICMNCSKKEILKNQEFILCNICNKMTKLELETVNHIINYKPVKKKNILQKIEEEYEKEGVNSDIFENLDSKNKPSKDNNNREKINFSLRNSKKLDKKSEKNDKNEKVKKKSAINKEKPKKKKIYTASDKLIKKKSTDDNLKESFENFEINSEIKNKKDKKLKNAKTTQVNQFSSYLEKNSNSFIKNSFIDNSNVISKNNINLNKSIENKDYELEKENNKLLNTLKDFIKKEKDLVNSKMIIQNDIRKNYIQYYNKFKNLFNSILNNFKVIEIKFKKTIKDIYDNKINNFNLLMKNSKEKILKVENMIKNINYQKIINHEFKTNKKNIYLLQNEFHNENKEIIEKIKNFEIYFMENFNIDNKMNNNANISNLNNKSNYLNIENLLKNNDEMISVEKSIKTDLNKSNSEFKNYKNSFYKEKKKMNWSFKSKNSLKNSYINSSNKSRESFKNKVFNKDLTINKNKKKINQTKDFYIEDLLEKQSKNFINELSKLK